MRRYMYYPITDQEYTTSRVMYVEFYLGLIGDKFHYNTSGATPFLKQLFLKSSLGNGVCFIYKWVEEVLGWATQQYRSAIDSVFIANYSICAYHSPLSKRACGYYSEFHLSPQDTVKLRLAIIEMNMYKVNPIIMVTLNFVNYVYLTKQDQLHLFLCIQGLRDKDSNCHGLMFPSVTSLTVVSYYPHNADTLYKIKKVLPNLKHIDIIIPLISHWEYVIILMESLPKVLKQLEIVSVLLNLKVNIHLDIEIGRCNVEGTRMSPYINDVALYHITLTGVCHNNNTLNTQYICKNLLEYSTYVKDAAHAQSLVTCIQQAQSLETLSLVYYEGATDEINQKEIFRNLPQTLQTLNICGFEQSTNHTFCDDYCNVSSTLDIRLIVDALMERKDLHTLTISISNVGDMKILTQLTSLIHLHIILDDSFGNIAYDHESVDKSTIYYQ